jgi:HEAT repeat protein
MRWVATSALLFHALYFFLAFSFSQSVELAHPVENEMTAFLGTFRGITTASAFLVSLLIATRFNARYGIMAGFLALAIFDLLAFSALSISSTFMAIVAFRFLHEAWQSGITRTAWFALFNIVPPVRREQTRMFVNGICLQVGVMFVGITLLVGTELLEPHQLYVIGAVAAGLTLFAIIKAREAYLSALVEALRAGRPQVFNDEEDPFRSFQQDAAAMNVAMAGLADPDPAVRRIAADVLSNLNVPEAVPSLVEALADGNVDVRVAVLPALARLNVTSAWDNVVACLADPEAEVRAQAISTLRWLAKGNTNFSVHVQPMLDDPVPSVRAAAATSLLAVEPHGRAQETLRQMCAAEDTESRVEALNGFGAWGNRAAFEPVEAALDDPQPTVRRAAASALARIDDPRCAETLLRSLGDDDRSVREAVAESIGVIGLPALEPTVQSLDDPVLEGGALLALESLPVASRADSIRAYARKCVSKALLYHRLWQQTQSLVRRNGRAQLLVDSLRHVSMHQGINALRATAVLGDTRAIAVAIDSLKSADPMQLANAVERLELIWEGEMVWEVLGMWEEVQWPTRAYHPSRRCGSCSRTRIRGCAHAQPWPRSVPRYRRFNRR